MELYVNRKKVVSMGSPLGPVLVNIIMTELERVIVEPLITSGKIKFYARYVDDTVLLAKEEDINDGLKAKFSSCFVGLEQIHVLIFVL